MAEKLDFLLPDIGDFAEVDVVEVLASVGEHLAENQALIVLESDKATMEVPSPAAGVLEELRVRVGDKVSAGALIAVIRLDAAAASAPEKIAPAKPAPPAAPTLPRPAPASLTRGANADDDAVLVGTPNALAPARGAEESDAMRPARAHASPSVRQLARDYGTTQPAAIRLNYGMQRVHGGVYGVTHELEPLLVAAAAIGFLKRPGLLGGFLKARKPRA